MCDTDEVVVGFLNSQFSAADAAAVGYETVC